MFIKDIIHQLEKIYPLDLQEEWDHSGLQLGSVYKDVDSVMISLNCDLEVINECISKDIHLLITHHPFLFHDITLDYDTYVGQMIQLATKHDITIYSMHTNLDKVSMNVWLAEALQLKNIQVCEETGIARSGELEKPMSLDEFLKHVKETFGLTHISYAGHKNKIFTVTICGGSGGSFIDSIKTDAYITGDLKYHQGEHVDFLLVNVSHHIESIMVDKLAEQLSYLNVYTFHQRDYFTYE